MEALKPYINLTSGYQKVLRFSHGICLVGECDISPTSFGNKAKFPGEKRHP